MDLTCCCRNDFDINVIIILFPDFLTLASSSVLIGDGELQEEDLKVEKFFFPLKSCAAFFIISKFRFFFTCQALFKSRDKGAVRFTIT